jgi:hypothetical protein
MAKIAISYRRADSAAMAGRICDRLIAHYGEDAVFMDVDKIPFGIDFRDHIRDTLLKTDVVIAVIGPNWVGRDAGGAARIAEVTDPVRAEIETALGQHKAVIPVLVDGARMPSATELPPPLAAFAFLNAAEVSSGRDFRVHMDRVIDAIDRTVAGGAGAAPWRPARRKRDAAAVAPDLRAPWLTDTARYLLAPLILIVVAHHLVVNALDLNVAYLWLACVLVPFSFGLALFSLSGRGTASACAFALVLGLLSVAAMTASQSLNTGDPIMPQSRFEWRDNIQFAAAIALSFVAGHVLARLARALVGQNLGKPG